MTNNKPFFSIGVTSYKRIDLLRQCIRSIISQTYTDFEVLIGNDDPSTIITAELLGISDDRVKIHNHIKNLGEVGNMNHLLSKAEGLFFTLQADDDLYEPQYLEFIHTVLQLHTYTDCVYTKFKIVHGETYPSPHMYSLSQPLVSEGSSFIHNYLEGKCRLMPVCGMFRKKMLIDMGGINNPSNAPIGLFGEYILLLSIPLNSKLCYINLPLVMYRVQFNRSQVNVGGVWNSTDISQYKSASLELIMVGARLFSQPQMKKNFMYDMSAIIALCLPDTFAKWIHEKGRPEFSEILSFFRLILKSIRKELSNKYSIIVGILLLRYLIIQFAYAKTSIFGEKNKFFFMIEKIVQSGLRGLLFFVYRPPALFWRENDTD